MTARVRPVELSKPTSLEDQALVEEQAALAAKYAADGRALAERLGTNRVWMINSTATGGGVAEMLPHTCGLLREAGVDARWLVLEPDDARFFATTKALHHMLHGKPAHEGIDADLFDRVSREAAQALVEHLEPGDVVVVHDPQPCGVASFLPDDLCTRMIWRLHVGVPSHNEHTHAAWSFLAPRLEKFSRLLFTSERYIPVELKKKSDVIQPAIDPLSHKNRELSTYKLLGVLRAAGIVEGAVPQWARFEAHIERYFDGAFKSAPLPALTTCPAILHVSRFDPLKGFDRSVDAFTRLCTHGVEIQRERHLRAVEERVVDELSRSILVLAGPDPLGVADDPEARRVLEELCARVDVLPAEVRARIHILKLPMNNAKQNALMVNALQRIASLIVQPSVEEGFGLTVTEALWKRVPVVATDVGGIAQQIRPGMDGVLVDGSIESLTAAMVSALTLVKQSEQMARAARQRVAHNFLSLREAACWLAMIQDVVGKPINSGA